MLSWSSTRSRRRNTSWTRSETSAAFRTRASRKRRSRLPCWAATATTNARFSSRVKDGCSADTLFRGVRVLGKEKWIPGRPNGANLRVAAGEIERQVIDSAEISQQRTHNEQPAPPGDLNLCLLYKKGGGRFPGEIALIRHRSLCA